MTAFAIAGLQLDLAGGDNVDAVSAEIRLAKRRFPWVEMILLGELSTYGPSTHFAEPMPGPTERRFQEIAREIGVWLIPGSLYESWRGQVYNTASVINPDGVVVARYRKIYPFLPYEQGVAAGDKSVVFDVPGAGRFGLSICYDMWFPETTRTLAWMGAEVILHPVMTNTIDRDVELCMARASAASNQCYVFDINVAGRLGNGRSVIVGPGGEVVHQAGGDREIMPIEVDFAYVRRVRDTGWHGLGQPLKSFRDGPRTFAPYDANEASTPLNRLGAMLIPREKDRASPSSRAAPEDPGGQR